MTIVELATVTTQAAIEIHMSLIRHREALRGGSGDGFSAVTANGNRYSSGVAVDSSVLHLGQRNTRSR